MNGITVPSAPSMGVCCVRCAGDRRRRRMKRRRMKRRRRRRRRRRRAPHHLTNDCDN